jgi:hypothetical protein
MSTGAIDGAGNMAFGYSTSSSATFPSLAVATRAAGDASGTLGNESVVIAGKRFGNQGRLDCVHSLGRLRLHVGRSSR